MTSKHWMNDRQSRQAIIDSIGEGQVIKEVVVDDGDPRGATIHKISSTGIITVVNQKTMKLVTKKIARVGQLIKLYDTERVPSYLIRLAREHQSLGYNMM